MKKQIKKEILKEMNRNSWRNALRTYNHAVDRYNHAVAETEFWQTEMFYHFDNYNNHVRLTVPKNKQATHIISVCGKKVITLP